MTRSVVFPVYIIGELGRQVEYGLRHANRGHDSRWGGPLCLDCSSSVSILSFSLCREEGSKTETKLKANFVNRSL